MPAAADIYYHLYEGAGEGEKPPVVLVHGAGGTHLYWPSELRRMPGFRIYALDLPGHGKSGGTGQQSIQAYARSVLAWMDSLRLSHAVLAGHSMGSAICLALALEHPERVAGLGLVGAAAHFQVDSEILESAAGQNTFLKAVDLATGRAFSPEADPRLVELAALRMGETRPAVLYGDFLASQGFDLGGDLARISCPAIVISGADDRLTPPRQAQHLASSLPNAQVEIIPGAGHMVMLEKPAAVALILLDFLQRL